jgi:hypothetical protein
MPSYDAVGRPSLGEAIYLHSAPWRAISATDLGLRMRGTDNQSGHPSAAVADSRTERDSLVCLRPSNTLHLRQLNPHGPVTATMPHAITSGSGVRHDAHPFATAFQGLARNARDRVVRRPDHSTRFRRLRKGLVGATGYRNKARVYPPIRAADCAIETGHIRHACPTGPHLHNAKLRFHRRIVLHDARCRAKKGRISRRARVNRWRILHTPNDARLNDALFLCRRRSRTKHGKANQNKTFHRNRFPAHRV